MDDTPGYVAPNEVRFVAENAPVHPQGLVSITQGVAVSFRLIESPTTSRTETRLSLASPAAFSANKMSEPKINPLDNAMLVETTYLSSDLYGPFMNQVHTIFDSGAAINFRLPAFPTTNRAPTGISIASTSQAAAIIEPQVDADITSKNPNEEDGLLLGHSESQADTKDDTESWTVVVNTRKEKRRSKQIKDSQVESIENTKTMTGPDQSPFAVTDEDWVENHFQPRERQTKKSRKSPYHPRSKLGLPSKKQYPSPQYNPDGGPKYYSKLWDVDIIVLTRLNATYSQQPSPTVPSKNTLKPSLIVLITFIYFFLVTKKSNIIHLPNTVINYYD